MTIGRQIIDRCTADRGHDTYSQPRRTQLGYSDCSSYLRRVFAEVAGIDIGSYTTAIATSAQGRTISADPGVLRSGADLQDGDVVLFGWRTDHRPGYPYSHVEVWDAQRKGTWGQYGDVPPHNGPTFHAAGWGLGRVDRILVRRFLVGEATTPVPTVPPMRDSAPLLAVDGVLGVKTIRAMQEWAGAEPDGIWGPATTRALQEKVGARVDGVRGPETTRKLQAVVGAKVDGQWGPHTTAALQRYLNTH